MQRPTKQAIQEQKDTIVVVGRARQKRKRRAEKHGDLEADTSSTNKNEKSMSENKQAGPKTPEPQEPFDFSSIPNILDDDPDNDAEELSSRRRKKQKKLNNKGSSQPVTFVRHVVS